MLSFGIGFSMRPTEANAVDMTGVNKNALDQRWGNRACLPSGKPLPLKTEKNAPRFCRNRSDPLWEKQHIA
jgi:hypothetical protein